MSNGAALFWCTVVFLLILASASLILALVLKGISYLLSCLCRKICRPKTSTVDQERPKPRTYHPKTNKAAPAAVWIEDDNSPPPLPPRPPNLQRLKPTHNDPKQGPLPQNDHDYSEVKTDDSLRDPHSDLQNHSEPLEPQWNAPFSHCHIDSLNDSEPQRKAPLSNCHNDPKSHSEVKTGHRLRHTQNYPRSHPKPQRDAHKGTQRGALLKHLHEDFKNHFEPQSQRPIQPSPCPQQHSNLPLQRSTLTPRPKLLRIVVDATPRWIGGYCIDENESKIEYYSEKSMTLPWSLRNKSKKGNSTEFEMKNLLCALFLWEPLILKNKTVQIYTDNRAISGSNEYARRIQGYIAHLQHCRGVEILNSDLKSMVLDRTFTDFADIMEPADDLSRRKVEKFIGNVPGFENFSYERILCDTHDSIFPEAKYWARHFCHECEFHIELTGSLRIKGRMGVNCISAR